MAAISITAANVKPSVAAQLDIVTLGAVCTAGQVVYPHPSTGLYHPARGDDDETANPVGMGILASGGGVGQRAVIVFKDDNLEIGGTTADAAVYALSFASAGAIVPTTDLVADDTLVVHQVIFGTGKPSNKLAVNFNLGHVIKGEIAPVP